MAAIYIWTDGKIITRASYLYWREAFATLPTLPEGYAIAPGAALEIVSAIDRQGNAINPVYVGLGYQESTVNYTTTALGVTTAGSIGVYYPISLRSDAGINYTPDDTGGSITLRINPDAELSGMVPFGWIVIPQVYNSSSPEFPYNILDFNGGDIVHGETMLLQGELLGWSTYMDQKFILLPIVSNPIVTFDPNGGYLPASERTRMVAAGSALGELPTPTRTGFTFDGWYTEPDGGETVTAETVVPLRHVTYYAHWLKNTVHVTLDAQGGIVQPPIVEVTFGAAYGELPTPTRAASEFDGWYTEPDGGGSRVTAETVVAVRDNHTLYAKWLLKTGALLYSHGGLIYDDALIEI